MKLYSVHKASVYLPGILFVQDRLSGTLGNVFMRDGMHLHLGGQCRGRC